MATSSWCRALPGGAVRKVAGQYLSNLEKKLAMHAGHAETALMLALAPQTVHMERAVINYLPVFLQPAVARWPSCPAPDRTGLRTQRRDR